MLKFPAVAATIYGPKVLKLAKKAKKLKADIIELRIDKLPDINAIYVKNLILKIKKITKLPIIGTIRKREESGENLEEFINENERLELFKNIIPLVDFVDIELSAKEIINNVIEESHKNNKKVIISYHNFTETPSENFLLEIVKKAKEKKGDIIKIATYVRNSNDAVLLLNFLKNNSQNNLIIIGMGEDGIITRLVAPILGSCITYGYVGKKAVAPGQLNIKILVNFLKNIKK
jgi:3-dehydroquinate dehydratase-1